MIANQVPLLKRELWEHRPIYVTPLVIAVLISLMSVTGQVTISANHRVLDLALLGASDIGERERATIIAGITFGVAALLALAMLILAVFYSLDALYAERKDRSILFWRSMPCTDAETVVSKLVTALLVIPLVTFVVAVATQLAVLASTSIWVAAHGADVWRLMWSAAPLGEIWLATLAFFIAVPLWLSPFIGWFLFVSALARRSPLLLAFLPIFILPMLEKVLIGTTLFTRAFFVRSVHLPLFRGVDTGELMLGEGRFGFAILSRLDIGGFVASPSLWLGLLVCGLLTTAAIYLRRYRDDSYFPAQKCRFSGSTETA
jgi:ABC-2 type transport system permease protein